MLGTRILAKLPTTSDQGRRRRTGRFEILGPFTIQGLAAARLVRVYVPFAAPRAGRRPVLLMFDGQNVFHDEPSFAGGWHLHEAVEKLAQRGIPPPVVVAVDHGGVHRLTELSPWEWGESQGKLDVLLDWIVRRLLPELRPEYGLSRSSTDVVVGGSSMGGLAAFHTHLRHPAVFGGAMCLSPAFWFANRRVSHEANHWTLPQPGRIYLDCGAHEARGEMLRIARAMADLLRARGYPPDQLRWRADKRGHHRESDWRRRVSGAMRFVFQARFCR